MTALKYFTFAGKDSRTYFKFVNKIERPFLPPISVPAIEVPNRSGSIDLQRNEIGTREIKFTVTLIALTDADLRAQVRTLSAFLIYSKAQELIISDEPNRKYFARFNQSNNDLEEIAQTGQGELTFTCFDPFAYSTVENNSLFMTELNTITNNGSTRLFPRFRVVPSVAINNFQLTNLTTGATLTYNAAIGQLVPVIFDFATNQVYLESTKESLIKNVTLNSTFFPLEIGANNLKASLADGSVTGVNNQNVRIYWTERFY